jgi:hypothetical protein
MRTLFLTLVATSGAFAFIGTGSVVAAKAGKSNPSFQVTTQKTAVAPARQNDRSRGRYQLRLHQARELIR